MEPKDPRSLGSSGRATRHDRDRARTTRSRAGGSRGPSRASARCGRRRFAFGSTARDHRPARLIAHWKEHFPTFWPKSVEFYAPLAGITPGEVALLEIPPLPGAPVRMSTGVMVIYADDESFTFMTPEGHTLSAWITFSAFHDGDATVVQVQVLERPADPFIELTYMLGGSRMQTRFWEQTLDELARHRRHDRARRRDDRGVRRSETPVAVRPQPAPQRDDPLDDADRDRSGPLGGEPGPRPRLSPPIGGRR